jgi:hypothetical protein
MALVPFLLGMVVIVCGYYFEWLQDDGVMEEKRKDSHGKGFSHVFVGR